MSQGSAKFLTGSRSGRIIAMTLTLTIAGGALVARSLGENQPERATEMLTHVLIVGTACAMLVAAVAYANLHTLTGWIGASATTQALAVC